MKRLAVVTLLLMLPVYCMASQFIVDKEKMLPSWILDEKTLLSVPEEGLWSIATEWNHDWMGGWKHAFPEKMERSGDWVILSGRMVFPQGTLLLRDAYREEKGVGVRCRRRFEWQGSDTLSNVNLSVRLRLKGEKMQTFMPVYYIMEIRMGLRLILT